MKKKLKFTFIWEKGKGLTTYVLCYLVTAQKRATITDNGDRREPSLSGRKKRGGRGW